ncbi:unnamed protein product [Lactuca virosa]|uniref:Uncharacterized protein n=1 Tax=Lactuca virosa TaxID=75947 RepID=A0AAU9PDB7_9ASTR|nr:unnamed protein product [Lactuca virosa]
MKSSTAFFSKMWTHLLRRRNNSDSPSIQSRKLGHLRSKAEIGTPIYRLRFVSRLSSDLSIRSSFEV